MQVACPQCQKTLEWSEASPYRPFCCKQCQLIDLGEWANEEKAIPCGPNKDHETTALPDIEEIEAMLAEKGEDFFR